MTFRIFYAAVFVSGVFSSILSDSKDSVSAAPRKTDSVTSASTQKMKEGDQDVRELELTLEELAAYNGKNGKPAFVAVDGIIYDVSDSKPWKNGVHKGRHTAGNDLSDAIKKRSPHGIKVLKKRKVVGKIVAPK